MLELSGCGFHLAVRHSGPITHNPKSLCFRAAGKAKVLEGLKN